MCITLERAAGLITVICRPTVALRSKGEFHGYMLSVHKADPGKKGSVQHSWQSLVCIIFREVTSFIILDWRRCQSYNQSTDNA